MPKMTKPIPKLSEFDSHLLAEERGQVHSTREVLDLFGWKHPEGVFKTESKAYNCLANELWHCWILINFYRKKITELEAKLEGRLF